jgi:hypothetical protein
VGGVEAAGASEGAVEGAAPGYGLVDGAGYTDCVFGLGGM